MVLEIFKFQWFYGSKKLFLAIKVLIKLDRQKMKEIPHTVLDTYLTNHLVKFLQDKIKPWRVGALRACTGCYQFFYKKSLVRAF